jgi:cytochrome c oxidase subunit 2
VREVALFSRGADGGGIMVRKTGRSIGKLLAAGLALVGGVSSAHAQAPRPWEMGMQPPFSPVAERITSLHDMVLVIITLITLLVGALLVTVLVRFNHRANPNPSKTSHNTLIEVIWTVVPILILVIIAIPSLRLVYYEDRTKDPELTIKVTAHQWYWEYGYPDQGNLDIESRVIPDDQLKPGQLHLLEVDNPLVVPVGKNIRILTTSTDVIHSFFIPSLGVQRYAIPGRVIETWVRIDKPGTYRGECNQVCGMNHSQMPIVIQAVSDQDFKAWVEKTKSEQQTSERETPSGVRLAEKD